MYGSLFPQCAFGFCLRDEGLIAGDDLDELVVIPLIFGLGRRFDLHERHIVHHASIRTDDTIFGKKIIDLSGFHFGHHLVAIIAANRFDGIEIKVGGGLVSGVHHRGRFFIFCHEFFGPGTRFLVRIPVPSIGQVHALCQA